MPSSPPRERGLFPLPVLLGQCFDHEQKVSRSVTRRILKKNHRLSWCNDGINALNELAGFKNLLPTEVPRSKVVSEVVDKIRHQYFSLPELPSDMPTAEGALSELLCNSSVYSDERSDILPYDPSNLSLPDPGAEPIDLSSAVKSSEAPFFMEGGAAMLRSDSEASELQHKLGLNNPYCDPVLFGSVSTYSDFLSRLQEAGMIKYVRAKGRKGTLGVFFVRKKDGSLRLIFDTRVLNCKFKSPPKTKLPSTAAFANVEFPKNSSPYIASGDISNAFYRLGVPDALGETFALPSISASDSRQFSLNGETLDPHELLLPVLTVLPMGWSWSVLFCQSVLEKVVEDCVSPDSIVRDKCPGIVVGTPISADDPSASLSVKDVCAAVCVDNFAVQGLDPVLVNQVNEKIASQLRALGLVVHEVESAAQHGEFIGLVFAGGKMSVKTLFFL